MSSTVRTRRIHVACFLSLSVLSCGARALAAPGERVVDVPEGGAPAAIIDSGVLCGPVPPGWSIQGDGRSIMAPREIPENVTRQFALRTAETRAACGEKAEIMTVVATGRWPVIDPAATRFFPTEGRLEISGVGLKGLIVTWQEPGKDGATGERRSETCLEVAEAEAKGGRRRETCVLPISRRLSTDARLHWFPAHANPVDEAVFYDGTGVRIPRDVFALHPGRVIVSPPLLTREGVDVSRGPGTVPLTYPEAVVAAECAPARCDLEQGKLTIRNVGAGDRELRVRLKMAPRVSVQVGGNLSDEWQGKVSIFACPLDIVSPVLRDVPAPRLAVRMDAKCAAEPRDLGWTVGGEPAEVERVVRKGDDVFVVLASERLSRDRVTVTASRGSPDQVVVATATERSVGLPSPRATLELPGYGRIDFIPTNRKAMVKVAAVGPEGRFVLMPLPGAYDVESHDGNVLVKAEENTSGFASLVFAYRPSKLPAELADVNLAVVSESVQHQVRQASVPAPFATSGEREAPLVELICVNAEGKAVSLPPGKPVRIPFRARDSCRVVIHRERLRPEDGFQEIVLEVDVTSSEGASRPAARIDERMVLRPANEPKIFWIRGGISQFDRISVRVSHVVDEERYVISPTLRVGLPSVQWSVIIEGGRLRLYATAAIPSGLFRINEPSGQLSLNFGVLSRLTLLDELGKESLFGLELGVMGIGLISDSRSIRNFPATLAAVTGVGVRVPLGGGAAIGVHAWAAYEFRDDITDAMGNKVESSHLVFIFGPAISIGNAGTNL